jgi:hypothetical protein
MTNQIDQVLLFLTNDQEYLPTETASFYLEKLFIDLIRKHSKYKEVLIEQRQLGLLFQLNMFSYQETM